MANAQDITVSLTQSTGSLVEHDWGIVRNDAIDAQFRSDLDNIRQAELTAERDAVSLRVF